MKEPEKLKREKPDQGNNNERKWVSILNQRLRMKILKQWSKYQ